MCRITTDANAVRYGILTSLELVATVEVDAASNDALVLLSQAARTAADLVAWPSDGRDVGRAHDARHRAYARGEGEDQAG